MKKTTIILALIAIVAVAKGQSKRDSTINILNGQANLITLASYHPSFVWRVFNLTMYPIKNGKTTHLEAADSIKFIIKKSQTAWLNDTTLIIKKP